MRCTKSVKNLYFELLITCENMCNFNYSIFPYSRKFSLQTLKMGYLHCLPSQNSSKILVCQKHVAVGCVIFAVYSIISSIVTYVNLQISLKVLI